MVEDPAHSDCSWRLRSALRTILIIGGPGSGKGVLCSKLVQQAHIHHCSSGDMLRAEVARGSALGRQCEEIMARGDLLPSATVVALVKRQMTGFPGAYVALDGFPRSEKNYLNFVNLCGRPDFAIHVYVWF